MAFFRPACYEPLKLTAGEYKAQLTGNGWDGQYFHLGVPEEFAKVTTGLSVAWHLPFWDKAHQGELALHDAQTQVPWLCFLRML